MPEGPSILHLRNKLLPFEGKTVTEAGGYGPMPTDWIRNKKLLKIRTWGKHLFFVFSAGVVRVHLGLFGEVLINSRKEVNASFFLHFDNGEMNGYVVKAEKLEDVLEEKYDWQVDIMSHHFDARHVKKLMQKVQAKTIDEVLMNQNIFSGVGNKIRNEALYRAGIHPLSITGKIPPAKMDRLIREVQIYANIFFRGLETTGENDDFAVYQQEHARDGSKVTVMVEPKTKRKIYFSERRQTLYT